MGVDMRGAQPTPGNIEGGLTTIEEKSLGAIAKGGSPPFARSSPTGAPDAARAGRDGHAGQRSGIGDGDGSRRRATGRLHHRSGLSRRLSHRTGDQGRHEQRDVRELADDMDMDAGTVITDGEPLASVGERIFDEMLTVASGKLTAAERWDNAEFAINMIGPRV